MSTLTSEVNEIQRRSGTRPGKDMHVAEALSRNPLPIDNKKQIDTDVDDVEAHIMMVETSWSATAQKLERIRESTMTDATIQTVMHFTLHGWPNQTRNIDIPLRTYHAERAYLSVSDGLLLYCDRIVIPASMQKDIIRSYP